MAVLRAQPSGRSFPLPDRCLVGRSRACDLVLAAGDISGQHAVLQWSGQHWELQDLGSRNGTHLDDVVVAPGKRAIVVPGARIRFGREETWTLADAGPPGLLAVRLDTGESRAAEGGLLALPGPGDPVASIYQRPDGAWVCERGGEPTVLDDRAIVHVRDIDWKLYLPSACTATAPDDGGTGQLHVAALRLRLAYTRDEETIDAVAFAGERRLDLQARAHNYVLLVLARRRLADQGAGLPEPDQGWLRQDDLLRMLKMDENHLHISLHRARAQLARVGVADAASLVERRPGRQLRLGIRLVELVVRDTTA